VPTAPHLPGIELGDELGRGAYSVVYRARQAGTTCAVKIPRVRGRWTTWVYREAVALARAQHPGLPEVWEVGEADGLPYLVMELVEGETLADRLGRGPIPEGLALTVASQVASALAAVHDVGLVHRDVKPRNIVLEPSGRVRLVDFGFATPIERVGEPPLGTAGTPAYAAPEQLRAPPRVDGRTDLYGLGRVLSECMTGRLAIVGPRPSSPVQPFGRVIQGLVHEDPEHRYPDARALLTDLERVRQGRPIAGPTGYEAGDRPQILVGRDSEMQRLTQAWASVRLSAGAAVLMRGARGSGTSRLLTAYARKIRGAGGRRVLEARCRAGDVPLATLRRIFDAYLGSIARDSAEDRLTGERSLRAAAADHLAAFATVIAPKLAAILGTAVLPAEAAPEGFAEGAAELLVRLARSEGPLAICVDGAHWMDPVSRDVLLRVAHRVDSAPLLLLLAGRPEGPWMDHFAALENSRVIRVDLPGFAEEDVAALVASHLGVARADPPLVQRIAALGDGTPLATLEVLRAFLDTGALRPSAGAWVLDVARADRVSLPEGAISLLDRRLADVPAATRRVLEAAAIFGAIFRDDVLGRAVELEPSDLAYALAEARRAGLLESDEGGHHRFVHESLRERLEGCLDPARHRALHQRAAEVLDQTEVPDFDTLCATAAHYAAGDLGGSSTRAYRTARAAASAALDQFDNETALRFLLMARAAAEVGEIKLDVGYHRSLGEAQLRQGLLVDSLGSFGAALAGAADPRARATMLGRIAWVHSIRSEPTQAWAALGDAFAAVGVPMPVDGPTSLTRTLAHFARAQLVAARPRAGPPGADARAAAEILCDLHYQNARLALEQGKPLRMLQSAFEGLTASDTLGHSRAEARARAIYGLVLTTLGRRALGERELSRAQRTAASLGDPVTATFCLQLESLTACFAGEFDRALILLHECVVVRGHWLEVSEFCHEAETADLIESLRGRSARAWAWIARAAERVRRSHRVATMIPEHFMYRAQAALAATGGTIDEDPWLAAQVAKAERDTQLLQGFSRLLSWGPRARFYVETGDIGPAFEALVAEFTAEGHNPRFVHPTVVEYYIAVAHARLQQCFQAPPAARTHHVAALKRALHDLGPAARLPLFKTHRLYIAGCVAWLEGSPREAERFFAEAEVLALEETCPWVLYGIARARAHALRDAGRHDPARDQGRIAEAIAREHGSEHRVRWIRAELGLGVAPPPPSVRLSSRSSRSSRTGATNSARRQLAALLHVIRAPISDLLPEQQVPAVLDDLIRTLEAERGLVAFEPDPAIRPPLLIGRRRTREDWFPGDTWRDEMMRWVRDSGEVWPLGGEVADLFDAPGAPDGIDAGRVLFVPLFLHDQAVGAICLERTPAAPAFSLDDRDLCLVLSYQVPVSIELARLLAEREQLQTSLQQAQKMEAVGQLASGVAHDFANMLSAVRGSLGAIGSFAKADPVVAAELNVIESATESAGRLMRQLLGFSQDHRIVRAPTAINDVILDLAPILDRLTRGHMTLALQLDPDVELVSVDRASFEHVLVNLVVNGRDAMPSGGTLTIETRNVTLDGAALRRGALRSGDHVLVTVSDTGQGILPENLPRIFDPFFTTKPAGAGTGIGLTTAYAFVKRSDGHIEVSSEIGEGSTFRLYFPTVADALSEPESDQRSPLHHPSELPPTVH
jgi:signal transduction histidine kinase